MTRLAEYADARELTWNLTLRELRGRYKRSVLGWTWSLLNPLSTVLVFSIVFKLFLKIEPPVGDPSGLHNFAMFLLCGLIAWNYLASGMSISMEALVGNRNLIEKVYFPREILVVATVLSLLVTFLIELAVLSVLNVYFRDVRYLIGVALQALFYSAPIVYPVRLVPAEADLFGWAFPLRRIYDLNPLVKIVETYRDVLYDLRFPSFGDVAYLVAWSVGLLAVGLWTFNRLEPRLAEEV
ncbi:MAG TPA: ABC transporter permease [Acidimicrobiia bacterium]|nr:ABC transporter permease [Acidimicrobiia bacterium]